MPRVTFQAIEIVWIEVLGQKSDASAANWDDGGLISQLDAYLQSINLHPMRVPLGMHSPGRFAYGFHRPVAAQVTGWLRAHGAEELTARGET